MQYIDQNYEGQERRNFLRFWAGFPIRIKNPCSKPLKVDIWAIEPNNIFVLEVYCTDISSQGVGIVSSHLLLPQAELELWLKVPGRKDSLRIDGRIVWVEKSGENTWRAGVCFNSPQFKVMGKIQG